MSDEYQNGPHARFSTPDTLTTLTKERDTARNALANIELELDGLARERDTLAAKVRELEAKFNGSVPVGKPQMAPPFVIEEDPDDVAESRRIQQLEATIAACKEAGFVTEDGVLIQPDLTVYIVRSDGLVATFSSPVVSGNQDAYLTYANMRHAIGKVFSTREAAEKARRDEEAK